LAYGRSFVTAHFSLEMMMARKMLACLERSFKKEINGALSKGRDFYDPLWFMQQKIQPLEQKSWSRMGCSPIPFDPRWN
jgi:hypothetical protein